MVDESSKLFAQLQNDRSRAAFRRDRTTWAELDRTDAILRHLVARMEAEEGISPEDIVDE
jgi:hypothetical protein